MSETTFVKNELVEAIMSALPLADYISRFAKSGNRQSSKGSVLFHSPFRDDRNASLSVKLDTNLYYDFAENAGGNIVQFCARINDISYSDAMFMLAKEANINPVDFGYKSSEVKTNFGLVLTDEQKNIIEMNQLAQSFFVWDFKTIDGGRDYAKNVRHLSDDTINEFQLGFAVPFIINDKNNLAERLFSKGKSIEDVSASKIIRLNDNNTFYSLFSNRLIIPTHDHYGNLVGFAGRALDNEANAKYINSEANAVFDKGSILFNEYHARDAIRKNQCVILMEGYLDVITAWQHGIEYAVASMGTAFNEERYTRLSSKAKTIYTCFDSDQAGVSATINAFNLALKAHSSNMRAILIPNDKAKDVDEFLNKFGLAEFNKLIDTSVDYLEFLLLVSALRLDDRQKVSNFKHNYYSIMNTMKLSLVDQYYYLDLLANFFKLPFGVVDADYRESLKLTSPKSLSKLADIKKNDLVQSIKNDDTLVSTPPKNYSSEFNGGTVADDLSNLSPFKIKDRNESYLKNILQSNSTQKFEGIIEYKLRNPFINFTNIIFIHFYLGDKLIPQKLYFSHDLKTLNDNESVKFNREYIKSLYGPERYGIPISDGKNLLQVQDLNVIYNHDGSNISLDSIDSLFRNYVSGGYKYLSYDAQIVTTAVSNILKHKDYGDISSLLDDDVYTLSEDASAFLLNSYSGISEPLKSVAVDILTGYILQLCKGTDVKLYASRISSNLNRFFDDSHGYSITEALDKLFTLVDYRFKQISNQCEFLYREQHDCQYQNEVSR